MADLTKALVAEWGQIPAARFDNLVESLPREWRLLQQPIWTVLGISMKVRFHNQSRVLVRDSTHSERVY